MAVSGVSFGQTANRPYGYDTSKRKFTPEQAKKDFKPGIYDPEAQQKAQERTKKLIKTVFTLGVIGAGALLLFKTNKGKELLSKGKELIGNLLNKSKDVTKTLRTKIPQAEAMANREFALNFAQNEVSTVPLKGFKGVNVNKTTMKLGERAKYIASWNKNLAEVGKEGYQMTRAQLMEQMAKAAKA